MVADCAMEWSVYTCGMLQPCWNLQRSKQLLQQHNHFSFFNQWFSSHPSVVDLTLEWCSGWWTLYVVKCKFSASCKFSWLTLILYCNGLCIVAAFRAQEQHLTNPPGLFSLYSHFIIITVEKPGRVTCNDLYDCLEGYYVSKILPYIHTKLVAEF